MEMPEEVETLLICLAIVQDRRLRRRLWPVGVKQRVARLYKLALHDCSGAVAAGIAREGSRSNRFAGREAEGIRRAAARPKIGGLKRVAAGIVFARQSPVVSAIMHQR